MREFRLLLASFIIITFFIIADCVYAATFTVTNLNDSGNGSLRWAIEQANSNSGPDVIDFGVSGTISPASALPRILNAHTVIDASSQWSGLWPSGQPGITLDGTNAGEHVGLGICASNCHIRGLFITGFGSSGVVIDSSAQFNTIGGTSAGARNVISGNKGNGVHINNSNNNVVSGNYIGAGVNGTDALSNVGSGVYIEHGAKHNVIGGTSAGERNIISGNKTGVWISGSALGTESNKVSGNYIGTDITGSSAIGNTNGIVIASEAQSNIIGGATTGERNIISGNGIGVHIENSNRNRILGNYIGTNVDGNSALGNGRGVTIGWNSQFNVIGGTSAGERNVISGNNGTGVEIFGAEADNNTISGNYIGTDVTGTRDIGNLYSGIEVYSGAQYNVIGGTSAGERNVISGNKRDGVSIRGSGTEDNVVLGNYIGTDASGTVTIGNSWNGVSIWAEAQFNIIGGTSENEGNVICGNISDGVEIRGKSTKYNIVSGNYIGTNAARNVHLGNSLNGIYVYEGAELNTIDGNEIAFNGQNGINVNGADTDYNKISCNSIHDNTRAGIELEDGGNDEIAAPIITSTALTDGILTLAGSGAGANAMIEIFVADSHISGEGKTYLGFLDADSTGEFSDQIDTTGKEPSNDAMIVATTTHPDKNTSEFASPVPVTSSSQDYTSATISVETTHTVSKGNSFPAAIKVATINDLAGFQCNVVFDPAVLEVTGTDEGTFLSDTGGATYWMEPDTDNSTGMVTGIACAKTARGGVSGSGTLATITFKAVNAGQSYIKLQNIVLSDSSGGVIPVTSMDATVTVTESPPWDVNRDGIVNIIDIVLVGQYFGEDITASVDPNPDVNGDGVVNIQDIVLVGQHFGEVYSPAAPSEDLWSVDPQYLPTLFGIYNIMEHSLDSGPGFLTTKKLISRLISDIKVDRTEVFQNCPNPFNPDTWIPYQLAIDADVTIRIHDATGKLVRTLNLGHKPAGFYTTKEKAAYWDGRNEAGEHVASGIYFHTIQAGDYTATKKMTVRR